MMLAKHFDFNLCLLYNYSKKTFYTPVQTSRGPTGFEQHFHSISPYKAKEIETYALYGVMDAQ